MSVKQNELIEERFTELIREKLTSDEFWRWVSGWLDPEIIIEQAENWDLETKFEELLKLEAMIARSRKVRGKPMKVKKKRKRGRPKKEVKE